MRTPIKETSAVNPVRAVCERFIPSHRALSTKKPRAVKAVIRKHERLIMLFANGRWTVSGNVDSMYLYPLDWHEAKRKSREYYNSRGKCESAEITDYLPYMVKLGLLSEEERKAFCAWRREAVDAKDQVEELLHLTAQVEKLGARVVRP